MCLVYIGFEASFKTTKQDSFAELSESNKDPMMFIQEIPPYSEEKKIEKMEKKVVYNPSIFITDKTIEPAEVFDQSEPELPSLILDSIVYNDPTKEETPTVLIDLVDEVPIFPGCEEVDKPDQLACFNEKMKDHIKKNFKYPEAALDLGIEGRVNITFTIDQKGVISSLQMRGPSAILENEAERIILKLPQMTPGKQGGKPVRVPYSLPINFILK
jgi:protein TonB